VYLISWSVKTGIMGKDGVYQNFSRGSLHIKKYSVRTIMSFKRMPIYMLKSSVSHYGADMIALREKLITLRDNYGLVGVKGGTEVEAMSFEEIKFLKQVSKGIVPLTVKIGGPEARNDVEFMLSIGTEVILAPMIESVYSLKNFVDMMKSIDSERSSALAINIETITAYKSLEEIFGSIYFNSIQCNSWKN